jgi:hypothetical protein
VVPPLPTTIRPSPSSSSSSSTVVPSLLDAALHISGLWTGIRTVVRSGSGGGDAAVAAEEEEEQPISWALCLHRDGGGGGGPATTPTAFGAGFAAGAAGAAQAAAGESAAVYTLRGSWDSSSQRVELRQVLESFDAPSGVSSADVTYSATLSTGADGRCRLSGSWATVATADSALDPGGSVGHSGTFSCALRPSGTGGPAGLYLGEAVPDASCAAMVPRNPIKWVVSCIEGGRGSMAAGGVGQPPPQAMLGCGYFDDSGDFADSALLWFFLRGRCSADGTVKFDKVYEKKTGGAAVNYSGRVVAAVDDGAETIQGSWENCIEPPHTRGQFGCRRESPHEGMLPPAC